MSLVITPEITLADWELVEQFTLSRGPGGQNVNKTATAVELRFEADRSPHLTAAVKARLKRLAGRRWTQDGAVLLRVEDTRSQARNREIARERLAVLVRQALVPPKRRRPTKPSRGAIERRLQAKAVRASTKKLRSKPEPEE